jgi:hypothetical protein
MGLKRPSSQTEEKRRLDTILRAAALAAIPAFPVVLLWRPLFGGASFFWGAPLLQFVPWLRHAAGMWLAGSAPLWNPLVGCGAPLAANYQTAAFYPLNAIHLLLPADVALTWVTALHLLLAGLGMYAWCRSLRLRWFPSLIGALALEGSGFLVARAGLFPSVVLTFAWVPVWMWRSEVLVKREGLCHCLWLGLSIGLGLLSGHAQTAAYGGLLVAAYVVFRSGQKRDLRRAVRVLALVSLAALLGLALAGIQLLPTAELLAGSHRSGGVDYDFAMTYSMWPWRLITFVAPRFFGTPAEGDYWGYATYWEDAGYVGLLPLLLAGEAVLAARSETRAEFRNLTWFLGAGGVITLLLALGNNTPIFPVLFEYLPGFDIFQAPARWLAVATVCLAALAAVGAEKWPRGPRGHRRGALGVALGLALLIGGLAAPCLSASVPQTFGAATADLGLVLAAVGLLALLQADSGWWRMAVVACVAGDLLFSSSGLVPAVDRSLYKGTTETGTLLAAEGEWVRVYWPSDPDHDDRGYDAEYRVKFSYLTFDDFGPDDAGYWRQMRGLQLANAGMLDGIGSANDFDPLLAGRYVDCLRAAVDDPEIIRLMGVTHVATDGVWENGVVVHTGPSVNLYRLDQTLGRAWIVPCGRQVGDGEALRLLGDPSFDPAAEVLLEVPAFCSQPSVGGSQGQVLSLQDGANRVTIRVALDGAGYLVLADTWYPEWHASVDGQGQPLLRANHAFRAVWLQGGEHTVEMVYRPRSFLTGARVSLVALTLFAVGFAYALHAGRRRSGEPDSGPEALESDEESR